MHLTRGEPIFGTFEDNGTNRSISRSPLPTVCSCNDLEDDIGAGESR